VWAKRGVAVLLFWVLAGALVAPPASAAPRVVKKKRLAPGVVYEQLNDTTVPVRMYVLKLRPKTPATLDLVLSNSQTGTFAKTSTMAAGAGALAAVNGDLNDWPGRPTHQYVQDGLPMQTGRQAGTSVGFRRNERGATIGHLPMRITATDTAATSTVKVASWNTNAPTTDQVVGYSWYGGRFAKPSSNECTARLGVPAAMRWEPHRNGTGRDYTVEVVSCGAPLAVTNSSKVVLASKLVGAGATWIKSLTTGATVHIGWSNGSVGAEEVVSGSALLLKGGVTQFAPTCGRDLCQRNPRTAVGIAGNGRIILVVVDGRTSVSVGYTLYQLGKEMQALGAVDAANLDGGGSATMWVRGLGVVNHPTDSTGERPCPMRS
jgi:Phosphodiester glycosidase